jgi:hypothetical protein
MSKCPALALIALISTVADAASLPLKSGTYVLVGTACKEPPFAAMFAYDGRAFSYPHATKCRSIVTARRGKTFDIAETCSALGDGTPTKPVMLRASYAIDASTKVEIRKPGHTDALPYRWCAAR